MSLVTLSAAYGAGGSEVGPELAQRLGVPFVDRLIPAQVADGLGVRNDEACAHDEVSRGWSPAS
jgi:Cytidylate kinase-like family